MSNFSMKKSDNFFKRSWRSFKNSENNIGTFIKWLVFGVVLTLIVEFIGRGNLNNIISYIGQSGWIFLCNVALVWGITLPIFLIKRRGVYYSFIGLILIGLAIVNKILVIIRGMPLTFSDFYSIKEGLSIANKYLSSGLITAIGIGLLAFLILIVLFWRRGKKNTRFSGVMVTVAAIIIVVLMLTFAKKSVNDGGIVIYPWDLVYSYNENGFNISFVNSYNSYKRTKPIEYNKKNMASINVNTNKELAPISVKPNIIMVQLEAFFDPLTLTGVELNTDPIPNFRRLSSEYSSGLVKVPTFGGGTARSDFESQTGMSMEYFSPGEIPYSTILKKQPVESIAYILKQYGYHSTALHNYVGNFYGRNQGLANLGFDNYISQEYMTNFEASESGWPRDKILVSNIKEAILSTEGKDYIYTITVQTHGPYAHNVPNKGIVVTNDIDPQFKAEVEYYANEQRETDKFINDLINMINSIDEPAIIAFYGDHLPALTMINSEEGIVKDKYETPYFIYNNIALPKVDENIYLYELSTKVLNSAGINTGIMPQVHNKFKVNEYYDEILKLVQYDLLFGNNYIVNLEDIYPKTELVMGIKPISISKVTVKSVKNNNLEIHVVGENFNQFSSIFIGNNKYDTKYIDNHNLSCIVPGNMGIKDITVKQIGQHNAALTSSEAYNLP